MLKEYNYKELHEISEPIIIKAIQEKPLSVSDIEKILIKHNINYARRLSKELAWRLSEEGKAFFNDQWLLEIKCSENQSK